jgi:hypothetical protein
MKDFMLFVVFFFIISCSDSDKFSGEKKQQIQIEGINYKEDDGKLYLLGNLQSEIKNCVSSNNFGICDVNNCWRINGKYCCYSLKKLDACYLRDYLWIIDKDTIPSFENLYDVGYGEHLVKLILVDTFGDSISYSDSIQIDKPLKITLLSPIENYEASETDTLVFQYHISGIDTWETFEDTVYVSTDESVLENETLLWEEGKAMKNKSLDPPLNKQAYYWGVKVSNPDTAFYSRIRTVCIEN